jgi:hypothetical protein
MIYVDDLFIIGSSDSHSMAEEFSSPEVRNERSWPYQEVGSASPLSRFPRIYSCTKRTMLRQYYVTSACNIIKLVQFLF